jgi:NO-binding membrane sensor protein with MHYT domain
MADSFWQLIANNPSSLPHYEGIYQPFLVLLSVSISVLASYAAISVVERMQ